MQAEYIYNALGQQVIRRLTQTGETIHAVHDMDGNRIAEYLYDEVAGTSTLLREYIWLEGTPVAVYENEVMYYIRTDHIGRPVFATDDAGTVVSEASYLPFGGVHATTGTPIDLRFPGQWFQSESGLYQNWMRDYDPTTGRYIQADPLGLVDGASVYGYARQNPGRYSDPTGEFGIAGAIIGAVSNLAIQVAVNYYSYGNLETALRCVDIKDVLVSGAFGAIGASPVGVLRSGGTKTQAFGVIVVTTFTKKVTVHTPIRVGDECECNGGNKDNPVLDLLRSLQL